MPYKRPGKKRSARNDDSLVGRAKRTNAGRYEHSTLPAKLVRARDGLADHVRPVHGGRQGRPDADRLIDFSSNITPMGTPASVIRALKDAAGRVLEYPDPDSSDLLAALARHTGLPQSNLLVGNGSVEIIYNFAFAFGGCNTLIPVPTFKEYEAASRIYGSHISHFASMDLSADLDSLEDGIPKNGMIFLCNPNNPTGSLLAKGQALRIIKAAADCSCAVLVDECFIELSRPRESVISYAPRYDNLLVLRSLTKSFGLPGIRIGYAAASSDMIRVLQKIKAPWSVNCMAQAAGMAALQDAKKILPETRRIIRAESEYLRKGISAIGGIKCYDTAANFMLIRTPHDSRKLQGRLVDDAGILVRDCSDFDGLDAHHIRIAVRCRQDNQRLVDALEAAS